MRKIKNKFSSSKSGSVPFYFILFQILSLYLLVFLMFELGSKDLWRDEVSSVEFASMKVQKIADCPDAFHSPLYYLLLKSWLKFVPKDDLTTGYEFRLRLFSIFFYVISLWVLFYFLSRIFEIRTVLLICLLFAISPALYLYSREVRQYSIFLTFALLSMSLTYSCMLSKTYSVKLILYAVASTIAFLLHYSFIFLVPVQMFIIFISTKGIKKRLTFVPLVVILLIFFIAYKFYPNLWRTIENNFAQTFSEAPYKMVIEPIGKVAYLFYVFVLGETVYPWNIYVVIPAVVVSLILFISGLVYLYRSNRHKFGVFTIWLLFPILVMSLITYRVSPKYLIFCIVPFFVILANGVASMRWWLTKFILVAVLIYCSVFSLYNYHKNKQFLNMAYIEPSKAIAKKMIQEMIAKDRELYGDEGVNFYNDFIIYAPYNSSIKFYVNRYFYYEARTYPSTYYHYKPMELSLIFDKKNNIPVFFYQRESAKEEDYITLYVSGIKELVDLIKEEVSNVELMDFTIWFIKSSPGQIPDAEGFVEKVDELVNEFANRFYYKAQWNYIYDADVDLKKKLVKKHFMNYRISVNIYEGVAYEVKENE